jgi:hypothetical protein
VELNSCNSLFNCQCNWTTINSRELNSSVFGVISHCIIIQNMEELGSSVAEAYDLTAKNYSNSSTEFSAWQS